MNRRVPKYQAIRQSLLEQAALSGSDLLPSERDIAAQFQVSRITAKKALNSLAADRLARREVGKGTFLIREQRGLRLNIALFKGPREYPPMLRGLADEFMRQHPDVTIEIQQHLGRDWYARILKQPGATVLIHSHVGHVQEMGLLTPLEELEEFDRIRAGHHLPALEWHRAADGERHCYSVPLCIVPQLFAFNRVLARRLGLDDASGPRCWDELIAWTRDAGRLRRDGVSASEFSFCGTLPVSYYLAASGGREFLHEDQGRMRFDFTHGEAWFRLFAELGATGNVLCPVSSPESPLVRGEALYAHTAEPWVLNQSVHYGLKDAIGLAPIPPAQAGGASFCRLGRWSAALVRDDSVTATEREWAWRFMRFLATDPDAQRRLCAQAPGLSPLQEVYREQQADPDLYPFVLAMATGRWRCDLPRQHTIHAIILHYLKCAISGKMSPRSAAEEAAKFCTLLIGLEQGDLPETELLPAQSHGAFPETVG